MIQEQEIQKREILFKVGISKSFKEHYTCKVDGYKSAQLNFTLRKLAELELRIEALELEKQGENG